MWHSRGAAGRCSTIFSGAGRAGVVGARPTAAALVMPQTGCPAEEAGSGSISGLACDSVETFSVCYLQHASKQSPRLRLHASRLFVRLCRQRWHVRGCSFVDGCGGPPEAAGSKDILVNLVRIWLLARSAAIPPKAWWKPHLFGVQLCDAQ